MAYGKQVMNGKKVDRSIEFKFWALPVYYLSKRFKECSKNFVYKIAILDAKELPE